MKKLRFEVTGTSGITLQENDALFAASIPDSQDKHLVWLTDDRKVVAWDNVEGHGSTILFYNSVDEYMKDHNGIGWIMDKAKKHFKKTWEVV